MGIEPYLVASALDCVLAQRLARKLCGKCKEPYVPTQEELLAAGFAFEDGSELPKLHRAVGCTACSNTGYKSRLALHEVMVVTEQIEKLVVDHASSEEIKRVAIAQGMISLRDDGMEKVKQGHTSIEEVLRVVV
jgi:type IV pilus assembly protein PilB